MKPVKQLLLAIALTGLCIAADLEKQVDEYVGAFVEMGRFSGSILVAKGGKVLAAKGYGEANLEHGVPNTPRTKFRLGSITKQFTATAILQLEQRGKLSLEDPVKKHLPGAPAAWDPVTVHHLLTHTSGIPTYTGLPGYMKTMFMPVTVYEMIAKFRDLPLEFQPGEKFQYDNSGYFLLGAIIEKVAGERYEDYLRKSIFEPLGMRDTGYDHFETILPNRASGYTRDEGKVEHAAYLDMSQPYSAGSLYSTVEDLLIWDQALYTEKLLPKTALDRMFTPFKDNYAYGWMVDQAFNRKRIAHGGGINGFNTMISRFPDDRVLVVVLSNTETGDTGRMARDLSAMVFGEKYEAPKERVEIKLDPARLDAFVGQYELRPGFILTVTKEDNQLMTQATGQGKFQVFPESDTKFFLKVVDAQVEFVTEAQGRVTHLVLYQGGRETKAKKIE